MTLVNNHKPIIILRSLSCLPVNTFIGFCSLCSSNYSKGRITGVSTICGSEALNRFMILFVIFVLSPFFVQNRYNQAKLSIHDRTLKVAAVVESLEREMELLCLTGVEDQLQADVRPTLELLRNAGIKVGAEIKLDARPMLFFFFFRQIISTLIYLLCCSPTKLLK